MVRVTASEFDGSGELVMEKLAYRIDAVKCIQDTRTLWDTLTQLLEVQAVWRDPGPGKTACMCRHQYHMLVDDDPRSGREATGYCARPVDQLDETFYVGGRAAVTSGVPIWRFREASRHFVCRASCRCSCARSFFLTPSSIRSFSSYASYLLVDIHCVAKLSLVSRRQQELRPPYPQPYSILNDAVGLVVSDVFAAHHDIAAARVVLQHVHAKPLLGPKNRRRARSLRGRPIEEGAAFSK